MRGVGPGAPQSKQPGPAPMRQLRRISVMAVACGMVAARGAATESAPVGSRPGSEDWQPPASLTLTLRAQRDVKGWLAAGRPVLTIPCRSGQPGVYVATGVPLEVTQVDQQVVRLRFDDSEFRPERWHEVGNWTISSRHPARLIAELLRSRRLMLEFTPFGSDPAQADFAVDGLAAYTGPLALTCGAPEPAAGTSRKDGK